MGPITIKDIEPKDTYLKDTNAILSQTVKTPVLGQDFNNEDEKIQSSLGLK